MAEVRLGGCRPEPLAHYLKALGILRLVGEQVDPEARAWWASDELVLASALDEHALMAFFQKSWSPTPIVGPWNGGSGFYPKDNREAIDRIRASTDPRLATYRAAIAIAADEVGGLTARPEGEAKARLVEALRSRLPDAALPWLDAAVVLTSADTVQFPPILGTGGNDGRLDFTNNYMQRIVELLLSKADPAESLLRNALFGVPTPGLGSSSVGQFLPSGAGGANATAGFSREALVNPWDFALMLEGAMALAGVATRRMESVGPGGLAYPFTVRAAGVGYASAAASEEDSSRNEIWLPLWEAPATWRSLSRILGEGRAKVRTVRGGREATRPAATGVDFARAVTSLGVARGLSEFVRYGFHQRNGLTYLATPLGRWKVGTRLARDLLAPLDEWLESFRRAVRAKGAPASAARAMRRVESAILDACAGGAWVDVVVALGSAEATLARCMDFARESYLRPIPALGAGWIAECLRDDRVEARLAASLASAGARERLVPVRRGRWQDQEDYRTVWTDASLLHNLGAWARRLDLEAGRGEFPDPAARPARMDDIVTFLDAGVDDDLLEALLRGFAVVSWSAETTAASSPRLPVAPWGVLRLVCDPSHADEGIPRHTPGIVGALAAGKVGEGVARGCRRLEASGLTPLVARSPGGARDQARRWLAALLFPISPDDRRALREMVTGLTPTDLKEDT